MEVASSQPLKHRRLDFPPVVDSQLEKVVKAAASAVARQMGAMAFDIKDRWLNCREGSPA